MTGPEAKTLREVNVNRKARDEDRCKSDTPHNSLMARGGAHGSTVNFHGEK